MSAELLWLAILSAFWPLLLVVDVLAFQTPSPVRTLVGFFAGGLLTATVVGTFVVVRFSGLLTRSRASLDPTAYIVCGLLALAAAFVVAKRPHSAPREDSPGTAMAQRAIKRGAGVAFCVGVVLNIVPGIFPIIALKDVAQHDYSAPEAFGVLTAFYLVMFLLVEVPIVGYCIAPQKTERRVTRFNDWLAAHLRRIALWGFVAGGVYLLVRGIAELL